MADSNITKKALATAFRELVGEEPFQKISVADICQRCDMNRKSFYYHFQDKYDLVNWIFDTEFIAVARADPRSAGGDRWDKMLMFCKYFDENRNFYRRILVVKGQNSLSEHFRDILYPILKQRLECIWEERQAEAFVIDFFTDGIVCSIERWLLSKEYMPPEQFVALMKRLIESAASNVYQDINAEKEGRRA